MAESAVGALVKVRLVASVKLVDPGVMLYTSNWGEAVITNKKLPAASRVMAIAVSPAVRVAAVEGAERLPSEPTL
jgi:hypothetical protein